MADVGHCNRLVRVFGMMAGRCKLSDVYNHPKTRWIDTSTHHHDSSSFSSASQQSQTTGICGRVRTRAACSRTRLVF